MKIYSSITLSKRAENKKDEQLRQSTIVLNYLKGQKIKQMNS